MTRRLFILRRVQRIVWPTHSKGDTHTNRNVTVMSLPCSWHEIIFQVDCGEALSAQKNCLRFRVNLRSKAAPGILSDVTSATDTALLGICVISVFQDDVMKRNLNCTCCDWKLDRSCAGAHLLPSFQSNSYSKNCEFGFTASFIFVCQTLVSPVPNSRFCLFVHFLAFRI